MITISDKSWHYRFIRFSGIYLFANDSCAYIRALLVAALKVFICAGGSGLGGFWFTYSSIITGITIYVHGFTFSVTDIFSPALEILQGWSYAAVMAYMLVIMLVIAALCVGCFLLIAAVVMFSFSDGVGAIREKVEAKLESSSLAQIVSAKVNKICVPIRVRTD